MAFTAAMGSPLATRYFFPARFLTSKFIQCMKNASEVSLLAPTGKSASQLKPFSILSSDPVVALRIQADGPQSEVLQMFALLFVLRPPRY